MHRKRAFSVFEMTLVVMVLAVMATVAAPRFGRAGIRESRTRDLCDALQLFRSQIELYKAQHLDCPPMLTADGTVAFDPDCEQMIYCTDVYGNVKTERPRTRRDEVYRCGPYLTQIPKNPFGGSRTLVRIGDKSEAAQGQDGGWAYVPETGDILANDSVEHAGL